MAEFALAAVQALHKMERFSAQIPGRNTATSGPSCTATARPARPPIFWIQASQRFAFSGRPGRHFSRVRRHFESKVASTFPAKTPGFCSRDHDGRFQERKGVILTQNENMFPSMSQAIGEQIQRKHGGGIKWPRCRRVCIIC